MKRREMFQQDDETQENDYRDGVPPCTVLLRVSYLDMTEMRRVYRGLTHHMPGVYDGIDDGTYLQSHNAKA